VAARRRLLWFKRVFCVNVRGGGVMPGFLGSSLKLTVLVDVWTVSDSSRCGSALGTAAFWCSFC